MSMNIWLILPFPLLRAVRSALLWLIIGFLLDLACIPVWGQAPQPQYVTNLLGDTIVLPGAEGPLGATYQWLKDGTTLPDDSRFTGSQTPTLTMTSADFGNTGAYILTADFTIDGTNVIQTNSIFVVYVIAPPAIQDFFGATNGTSLFFEVDATGVFVGCPAPMLYLGGTQDRLISSRTVKRMKVLRPDLDCIMLDAPHFVLQRAPAVAALAITGFLGRHHPLELPRLE